MIEACRLAQTVRLCIKLMTVDRQAVCRRCPHSLPPRVYAARLCVKVYKAGLSVALRPQALNFGGRVRLRCVFQ